MKLISRFLLPVLVCFAVVPARSEIAAGGPRVIFDPGAEGADAVIKPNDNSESDVTMAYTKDGVDVTVTPNGKSNFPGIKIVPASPWNATGYGHLETRVTNNGTKPIRVNMRIDNPGPWQENRWSANVVTVKPGASAVVLAIFGYQYGKAGYALQPDEIVSAIIFIGKSDTEQKFRVEPLIAAGPAGEKPYVDPNTVAVKPKDGNLLGGAVKLEGKQLVAKGGAKATAGADGTSYQVEFAGKPEEAVTFKPEAGFWNLNQYLQVRIKVKNTGSEDASLKARLESRGGVSDAIAAKAPIKPGEEAELVVPFMAAVPWVMMTDPAQEDPTVKKEFLENAPGTGTKYTSNTTNGVTLLADGKGSFTVTSIISDMPPAPVLPDWLGKRPPVDGDWEKTFDEDFAADTIDWKTWNIYTESDWHLGAATHYSKDNLILKDGKLSVRVEKKRGPHNDDPKMPVNDYQTGYADTFGKWTQRYGYFETRVKIPTAPNMFYAVWLMPDRGPAAGPSYKRNETKNGGMEYDVFEGLSIWGPNRHDFGMHWDSYQKFHKSIGMFTAYVHPDKEGFITVGMLWLPGVVVLYDNGKEAARWESPRVGNIQSYWIIDHVTGGWETEPMDDAQLPSDLVIDYVRAWQRKDLATPEDGPKPNQGTPYPDGAGPKP